MARSRIASLLVAMWSALQVYFLLVVGMVPPHPPRAWGIAGISLVFVIALWWQWKWARILALTAALLLMTGYVTVILRSGLAPCGPSEYLCDARLLVQPLLTAAVIAVLITPWPLTTRWSKRGRDKVPASITQQRVAQRGR